MLSRDLKWGEAIYFVLIYFLTSLVGGLDLEEPNDFLEEILDGAEAEGATVGCRTLLTGGA